jgi:Tfp pilus assembly protein PilO
MKSLFDKLNLRPQERRLVVIVGMIFFVVLNLWFIFPRFSEWGQVENQMDQARRNLQKFQTEIAKRPQYEKQLAELTSGGSEFLTNDLQLGRIVQSQAIQAGLQVNRTDPRAPAAGAKTNQFYQELGLNLTYTSDGKQLVDFLVGIASQNYMIRARELNVHTDPSQTRLLGNLVLVANLQDNRASAKKVSAPAASAPKTNRPPAQTGPARTATTNPPAKPPGGSTLRPAPANKPGSRPGPVRPSAPPNSKADAIRKNSI